MANNAMLDLFVGRLADGLAKQPFSRLNLKDAKALICPQDAIIG